MTLPPSPSRRGWAFPVAIGLGLLVLTGFVWVLFKAFGTDPRAVPFRLAGKPAPPFVLTDLQSGKTMTSEELKGHPLVINFWATWCAPCRYEHPVLQWGHKQFGHQVKFIGVVFEDSAENASTYLAEEGSAFPQLLDPKATITVDYGVSGVPETYFVDRAGIIRGKVAEPISPELLRARVLELLEDKATRP